LGDYFFQKFCHARDPEDAKMGIGNAKGFKNNGKLKLLIIVGTRPEIIRLSAVIKKCRTYFDTVLAHTGQTLVKRWATSLQRRVLTGGNESPHTA
jgi:hypothetical protein